MNQNGTISCEVDSNPPTTFIQWIKDGRPLNPTRGQTLQIYKASYNDSGVYSCQAFNSIGGSEVLEMHLIVSGKLIFVFMCYFALSNTKHKKRMQQYKKK